MKRNSILREYLIISLGTLIIAGAVFFFLVPSHLAVGSISGLAVVLSQFVPLDVSYITFGLNMICLILGFLLIGNEFGVKTVFTSILMPMFLWMLERLFPDFQSLTQDAFLDMVCYCFVVSAGLALLFLRNASSGGLDIAAKILNKFFRMDLGAAMSAAGIVVSLLSALCYDSRTVIISLMGTYLNGVVLDKFIFGMDGKKKLCIISSHFEEVRDFVINTLHSGATVYEAIGAYGDMPRRLELQVIVDKSEYAAIMKFMEKTDPTAFITVYTVKKINYISPKKGKQPR